MNIVIVVKPVLDICMWSQSQARILHYEFSIEMNKEWEARTKSSWRWLVSSLFFYGLILILSLLLLLSLSTGMMVIFRSTFPSTIHITNKSARASTLNVWKSHMWTADKDVNVKATFTLVKIRPEKIKSVRDLNPWPLWYRWSTAPVTHK